MMAMFEPANGARARPAQPPMNSVDAVALRVKPIRAAMGSSSGAAIASAPASVPRAATRIRQEIIIPKVTAARLRSPATRITARTI